VLVAFRFFGPYYIKTGIIILVCSLLAAFLLFLNRPRR